MAINMKCMRYEQGLVWFPLTIVEGFNIPIHFTLSRKSCLTIYSNHVLYAKLLE